LGKKKTKKKKTKPESTQVRLWNQDNTIKNKIKKITKLIFFLRKKTNVEWWKLKREWLLPIISKKEKILTCFNFSNSWFGSLHGNHLICKKHKTQFSTNQTLKAKIGKKNFSYTKRSKTKTNSN
jgi:hypothetical protein